MGGPGGGAGGTCVCSACGATVPHERGVPSFQFRMRTRHPSSLKSQVSRLECRSQGRKGFGRRSGDVALRENRGVKKSNILRHGGPFNE